MQAVGVSTVVVKWVLLGAIIGGCGLAGSALASVSERSGERVIGPADRLELIVPDEQGDLLLRITETGIDLKLSWSSEGAERQANAPGRRWGEQVLLLPADRPRPDRVRLVPLLAQAPSGQVRWQWERIDDQFNPIERRALALESAAAELAIEGDRATSERALKLYRQALDLHRREGSDRWIALSYRVGQLHSRLGDWAAAEAVYRPALVAVDADDHSTVSRLTDGLGYALYRQGSHELAKVQFDRAQSAALAAGDAYQLALSRNNGCLPLHAQGDMRAAADCLQKADSAYADAGIVEHRGRVLTNLASALSAAGQSEQAIAVLKRAVDLQHGLAPSEREFATALVRMHLAWALLDTGRYSEALTQAIRGQSEAAKIENDWLLGHLTRVTVATLAVLGQTTRANEQLRAVLATPALLKGMTDSVRLQLAAADLETDLQRRAELYASARASAGKAKDDYAYVRAWLGEGKALASLGNSTLAVEAAHGALAMSRQLALVEEEVGALSLLGELGPAQLAQGHLEQALDLASSGDLQEWQYRLLHSQARLELELGDWSRARERVVQADRLAFQLRRQLSADEDAGLRSRLRSAGGGALAAGALAPDLDDSARAQWLWQRLDAERSWAIGERESEASQPADYHRLRTLLMPASASLAFDFQTARRAESLRLGLEQPERQRAPTPWPSLSQLQAGMAIDQVMLVLLGDEPQSVALVVRADRLSLHRLGSAAQIRSALTSVARGLGRQDPLGVGALHARLDHLAGLISAPLADIAGAGEVRFLPGPGMEQLPLELLLQATGPDAVVLRLSAEAFQSTTAGRAVPTRVLILQAETGSAAGPDSTWERLPAVGAEVAVIKSMFDVAQVEHQAGLGAARSLSSLGPESSWRLIHIAGHAWPAPEWSSLELLAFGAGPEAQIPMGHLRHQQIRAELVVLSACRTALGGVGEMGLSFAQSFLAAGAGQVLASAWPVDDRGTAEFMRLFYVAHLTEGQPPAVALAQAQARMRSQERWKAPYWWAGFQLWQGLPVADPKPAATLGYMASAQP